MDSHKSRNNTIGKSKKHKETSSLPPERNSQPTKERLSILANIIIDKLLEKQNSILSKQSR